MHDETGSEMIAQPSHLVLTDLYWLDDEEREWFLLEMLLQTLLYETVLLQDEYLVLGKRIASWFYKKEDFELLKPF
ncbi:MAG: hypothetical protein COT91_01435 [Candidatus Doudnabacteria bacterium CG10_big_fil_rev_8_21_14_0_10_41_10]|uniref:Uncharacterized protein n=1 Tax=Candidatus Doudnabacteria bacterium CG10_big_fil_rev_8_21_14_0_10_41_10 TaxID=1974551 RepID=A0A2H0VGM2_9BACT|nr:MAG: hypothetical protein COT91_01435 [Candidatus Doudnabacteria bacterium CG10_big_fil_rev_8_21_14_0_10_41_10]